MINLRQDLYKCPNVFEDMEYYVEENVKGYYTVRLEVWIGDKNYKDEMIHKINDWKQNCCVSSEQMAFNIVRKIFDANNRDNNTNRG